MHIIRTRPTTTISTTTTATHPGFNPATFGRLPWMPCFIAKRRKFLGSCILLVTNVVKLFYVTLHSSASFACLDSMAQPAALCLRPHLLVFWNQHNVDALPTVLFVQLAFAEVAVPRRGQLSRLRKDIYVVATDLLLRHQVLPKNVRNSFEISDFNDARTHEFTSSVRNIPVYAMNRR